MSLLASDKLLNTFAQNKCIRKESQAFFQTGRRPDKISKLHSISHVVSFFGRTTVISQDFRRRKQNQTSEKPQRRNKKPRTPDILRL